MIRIKIKKIDELMKGKNVINCLKNLKLGKMYFQGKLFFKNGGKRSQIMLSNKYNKVNNKGKEMLIWLLS